MTRPAAADGLATAIAKALQDGPAAGTGVVVATCTEIADTIVDYLAWDHVQPLLNRFVTEAGQREGVGK